MEDFDFTEDEIKEQLEKLGYYNVPEERLKEFKRDLMHLVKHEKSKGSSLSSFVDDTSTAGEESEVPSEPYIPRPITKVQVTDKPQSQYLNRGDIPRANDHSRHVDKENIENDASTNRSYDIYIPTDSVSQPGFSGDKAGLSDRKAPNYSMYSTITEESDHEVPRPRVAWTSSEPNTSHQDISSDKRFMKRKVVRKVDGHSVIDESVTESEADGLEAMCERLRDVGLRDAFYRPASAHSRSSHYCMRPVSARSSMPSFRLPESYEGPTALIKPMSKQPHMRNVKKCDPVSMYQKYRKSWKEYKAPGEKAHKGLRWNLREQMAVRDNIVEKKPQKNFVANKYVVPTNKKRKNLRWQIRADLAQGVVPPSLFD